MALRCLLDLRVLACHLHDLFGVASVITHPVRILQALPLFEFSWLGLATYTRHSPQVLRLLLFARVPRFQQQIRA